MQVLIFLSIVNRCLGSEVDKVKNKIGRIKYYIKLIESLKADISIKFISDPIFSGALLHYLFLLTDSCIAVAEMIIKEKKFRSPQTYSETIELLGENEIIKKEFAYEFARISGLRNFLAHDYEEVDKDTIIDNILPRLADIKDYIKQIEESFKL